MLLLNLVKKKFFTDYYSFPVFFYLQLSQTLSLLKFVEIVYKSGNYTTIFSKHLKENRPKKINPSRIIWKFSLFKLFFRQNLSKYRTKVETQHHRCKKLKRNIKIVKKINLLRIIQKINIFKKSKAQTCLNIIQKWKLQHNFRKKNKGKISVQKLQSYNEYLENQPSKTFPQYHFYLKICEKRFI